MSQTGPLPPPRVIRRPHEFVIEQDVGGEAVSGLVVNDLVVRVGTARLRMGGVGGVWTKKEHRKLGYSARCMAESVAMMRREGFAVSMLFGISDFYHRWGFVGCIPEPRCDVPLAQAALALPVSGLRAVRYDPDRHRAGAARLDEAARSGRSGSLVRRPGGRLFRMGSWWGIRAQALVVLDRAGRVAGCAAFDKTGKDVNVVEAGARDRRVLPALMAALAREGKRRRAEQVTLFLPHDHPLVEYARRFTVKTSEAYYPNSQGMGRIVDLGRTLRGCAGELSRRLRASALSGERVALTLKTDIGAVRLFAAGGRMTVGEARAGTPAVRMPQWVLFQLLLGYRSVDDAAGERGVSIPACALTALRALFPPGHPFLWRGDRF